MKKIVAVILAVVLCAAAMSACSGTNDSFVATVVEWFSGKTPDPVPEGDFLTDSAPAAAAAVCANEISGFVGADKAQTEAALKEYGLTSVSYVGVYSDTVPSGSVVGFTMPESYVFEADEPIVCTYSLGKKPAAPAAAGEVPNVVGKTPAEAVAALAAAGFSKYSIAYDYSSAQASEIVFKQSVSAGKTAKFSTRITITVSKGPRPASGSAVGDTANDFTLPLMNGGSAKLSSFRGKVVLINFWATWCGPCVREMPDIQQLQAHYGSNLVVLAVSVDGAGDNQEVKDFVANNGYTFRILRDYNGAVKAGTYPSNGIPLTVIVDKYGVISYTIVGAPPDAYSVYKSQIDIARAR